MRKIIQKMFQVCILKFVWFYLTFFGDSEYYYPKDMDTTYGPSFSSMSIRSDQDTQQNNSGIFSQDVYDIFSIGLFCLFQI